MSNLTNLTETGPQARRLELPADPIAPVESPELQALAARAAERGRDHLLALQREDARWCAELESNPTITAEFVLMCQMLGMKKDLAVRGRSLITYLRDRQLPDGSWSVARCWEGDVSSTAECYLALRILGVAREDADLLRAERYIRRHGGLEEVRIFTRIFMAMFGLLPWDAIPAIPPEFVLLPPGSPVNIYALSSWARGTMVPLFIIFHYKPVYALPNGRSEQNDFLDHLWLDPADKKIPYSPPWLRILIRHRADWKTLFGAADFLLRSYEKLRIRSVRKVALERCTRWVLEHQEASGDWAGIFPPMLNGVLALSLQGYALDSDPVRKGLEAIHSFAWEDAHGYRIQACNSPIWDTVLSVIGLVDCGMEGADPRLADAMKWVLDRQIRAEHGDWKIYRPRLISGGWSFEYHNSWYPDVDDTAAVLLALLKQDRAHAVSEPVERATRWLLGMQNRDGGWGAFDVDNDKHFLNEIPFSDMDSLCDPSTPDVTGRVLEAFGLLEECLARDAESFPADLRRELRSACDRGIGYCRATQEKKGSWFGRWGVNYIYGTSNVLCAFARNRVSLQDPMADATIRDGIDWLRSVQNADGGWGESLASYSDKRWMGRGESTASQTAWALMALIAYVPANDRAIERGIAWLVSRQKRVPAEPAFEGGKPVPAPRGFSWEEEQFTGTGFPNHFYLRYHLYRHYFPLMALGRYLRASEN